MKSEIIEENKELKFPKLMVLEETVVLFTSEDEGTVLLDKSIFNRFEVGHHSKEFDMTYFKDFKGKIVLSNE